MSRCSTRIQSSLCNFWKMQSIRGRRKDGTEYRLPVDSGAGINLMKEAMVLEDNEVFPLKKSFVMGKDRHQSHFATYFSYLNNKHLFHIIPNDFPLPEDGIIGLPFFTKYDRYAITPKFLVLDNYKLPLHDDGIYTDANSMKVNHLRTNLLDKTEVWIEKAKTFPKEYIESRMEQ